MSPDPAGERTALADVAAGRVPADAVVRDGTIVDVHARRARRADVAVAGRRIAAVGDVRHCVGTDTVVHDCRGRYVLPGFLDPHLHIGFSQLSVERLAELLVPMGTVAVSACLSESASIVGPQALYEQLERSRETGLDLLLSAFFACALGPSLGRFTMEDLADVVRDERCVELREWSDRARLALPAGAEKAWREAVRRGLPVAGHLAGQTPEELQAAAATGVRSDHEAVTVEEALRRAQLGIAVQMRQGSGARDLLQLLPAVTEHGADPDLFSFCGDEQELSDLARNGHIDGKLRLAVRHGVAPVEAVRMATLNAARSMGLEQDYGAIVTGRLASIAVVNDLADFGVSLVLSQGRLLARDGAYLGATEHLPYPPEWSDTVHMPRALAADDFALPLPDGTGTVRVIGAAPNRLPTKELRRRVTIAGGAVVEDSVAKLAVVERHEASGQMAVGLIAGLGIQDGAVAASINAGEFNLMVAGRDDAAMALAANRVAELGGGVVVAGANGIAAELALPLFGILSDGPLEESVWAAKGIADAIREQVGSDVEQLVPCLGFACLSGFPELRMTARGMVRPGAGGPQLVSVAVDAPAASG